MGKREEMIKALAGKSIHPEGSLSFSCPKAEVSLKAGESSEGSFTVTGSENEPLLGMVVSEDIHVQCLTPVLKGSPAEIRFRFNSIGLEAGECVRGELKVISNQGEYTLPYILHVVPEVFETSLGQMKNLFHFTNLAKTNWEEAVKTFYRPDFEKILTGNDRQYRNLYRALQVMRGQEQPVEEFLIGVRKKQKVEYRSDVENLTVYAGEDICRESIALTRDGWGYTRLLIETEGEFLQTEKELLTDDDFLGNVCSLMVLIDSRCLHFGINYGKIHIYNEYTSLTIPVCVRRQGSMSGKYRKNRKEKTYRFYRAYLQYAAGKLSKQLWLKQAEELIDDMEAAGRANPVKELFRAHLLLTRECMQEAGWLLEKAGTQMTEQETRPDIWCYYLYLTAIVRQQEEYTRYAAEQVRCIYERDPMDWRAAWLLLYLDEEYNSVSKKWIFLEQQFEKGCRSPIWYMEAAALARENPAFLMKLTPFTMQILFFMAKYDYLTAECIGQIHYLAGRAKGYGRQMFAVLQSCYQKERDLESLRAICSLLIQGGKTGPEYVRWYREGIQRELWLTRLYEYYLLSVDMEKPEEIPVAALRYFSYKTTLPYDRMAYLYAYVIQKCDDYPDIYRSYLPQMEQFLIQQLEKGRMNRSIGCLYRKLIQEEIIGADLIGRYAGSLFIQEIRLERKDIRHVIVIHGKLEEEIICPVVGSCAYVPLYDAEYSLIFETRTGHRLVNEGGYSCRIISYPEEMLAEILPQEAGIVTGEIGVLLYQYERCRVYTLVNRSNVRYARLLWKSEKVRRTYKKELQMKLLKYYMDQDAAEELDAFLEELKPGSMNGQEREEVLRCMILRGMYEKAYEWIQNYGAGSLSAKLLFRLCSRILQSREEDSGCMRELAYRAFGAEKYDEVILHYLSENYLGTLREMRRLWHACSRFEVISRDLNERMLLQMLFTGERMEEDTDIFLAYIESGADEDVKNACLEHFAYDAFMKGRILDERIWKELLRKSGNGEMQSNLGKLAVLEYLSRKEMPDEEECRIIQRFLDDLILKGGCMLGFFRRFRKLAWQTALYDDQTFLEYRTASRSPVILHYMMKADGRDGEYRTQELQSCCPGVYTKRFSLFEGETVEYYISEKHGDKEVLAVNGTLTRASDENEGSEIVRDRFSMINDYIGALPLTDTEKAERLLDGYFRTEFLADQLFTLL